MKILHNVDYFNLIIMCKIADGGSAAYKAVGHLWAGQTCFWRL